ncbi:MAG: transketolase C-terminal domain-containing protein [Eubacteriales bacterium]|nr:transketolase C-terminal domain-containing protein [Eubacteriales bacterium]
MGKIANKQMICETLMEAAKDDKSIVSLCSDSRGSGSFTAFADTYLDQFVETGIAEQNLVSIAAGLAKCGKKAYAVSPACFLSTRSYEQCKVDVAYSNTNVKLIGISGGVSYGALGMSHHSAQDIAAMSAIPNMRVYIPSDHLQTRKLTEALLKDEKPAYVRVGRNAVDPVYEEENVPFEFDKATVVTDGWDDPDAESKKVDVAIVACGEMVKPSADAAKLLREEGIHVSVLDMYCVKPLDREAIIKAAQNAEAVLTAEEHAPFGGLGSMVAQVVSGECPKKVVNLSLPDAPVITGTSQEVFAYYGLNAEGIAKSIRDIVNEAK